MKICHIIYNLQVGGAELMLIDIINEQVKSNKVHLLIINKLVENNLYHKINNKIKIHLINRTPGSKNPLHLLKLNTILAKNNFDAIHYHNSTINRLLFIGLNKTFYTIHDTDIDFIPNKKITYIAISNAVKQDISIRYPRIETHIIENGIKTSQISRKIDYNITGEFKIVQVARLESNKKGQDLLIQAIDKLIKLGYNIKVDLIGNGPSYNKLKELIEVKGLTNKINIIENKDREWIYKNYKNYNLLAHPSRFEGFGLTIPESLCAGLPVLVSNIGGPFEIIQQGKYGNYFISDSIESLVSEIQKIINNYSEIIKKTKLAINVINRKYNIERTAKEYLELYKTKIK